MNDARSTGVGLTCAGLPAGALDDFVTAETIAEIAQSFWDAFLPDDAVLLPGSTLPATEEVRGRIDIGGSWSGSVELSCSLAAARRIAAAMFSLSSDALEVSDVHDAVGELVNVVGGNIKSILPAPTSLSVPTVGDEAGEWRFAATLEHEVLLDWRGEPVVVRVWRTAGPATS